MAPFIFYSTPTPFLPSRAQKGIPPWPTVSQFRPKTAVSPAITKECPDASPSPSPHPSQPPPSPPLPHSPFPNEGDVYHETLRPPPPTKDSPDDGDEGSTSVAIGALPGDGDPAAVTARLESYRCTCDKVVRSFALTEGGGGGGDDEQKQQQGEGGGGGTGAGGEGGDGVFQWESGGIVLL